ncbi:MAG: hypothetical protein Q4A17_04750 [Thermoguttaceae bacterium]|nr:hypothetical protein [Thermoguttaceae bacterium]
MEREETYQQKVIEAAEQNALINSDRKLEALGVSSGNSPENSASPQAPSPSVS